MKIVFAWMCALLGFPVLVIGSCVAYEQWREDRFNRDTPLAAGLHGKWTSMRDTFRQRIATEFPKGTPQAALIRELTREGFAPTQAFEFGLVKPDGPSERSNKRSKMVIQAPSVVCMTRWYVSWDVDHDQRVTRTYGDLGGYCL